MATLVKSGTLGSGSPLLAYQLYAEQTAASGTSRTIKITAKFKCNGSSSSSFYGYPCNWRARVGDTYGSYEEIKTSAKWYGSDSYRTFTQTIKIDVGTTSSKSITVGLQSNHSSYTSWNGTATGSFTVTSTNTAPTMSGYITCRMNNSSGTVITAAENGTENAAVIPEDTSKIYISWPKAADNEGGTIKYEVQHQRDDGAWVVLYEGTNTYYTHSIGTGNNASRYDYNVRAYDSAGLKSNTINATQFSKNTFTGNTLKSVGSINYSDGNTTLAFTYSGEKNTATLGSSNGTFTRTLECTGITVYNSTITKSPISLTIYKSGNVPSGPYVKFEDIKKKFSSSQYKGNLTFTLTTKNAYGSSASSQVSISVNLQTAPGPCSNIKISRNKTESTTIKTSNSTNIDYFIPDEKGNIKVTWSAGYDKLGGSVVYDLYYSIGGSTWQLVSSGLTTLYYNHGTISKLTKQQTLTYMVKTRTSYGTYMDTPSSDAVVLEYYTAPALSQNNIARGATSADVSLTVKSNSSILNIETRGTWSCKRKDTKEEVSSGTLSITQNTQVINVTNLTEEGTYDLVVTFNDNTGFSSDDQKTIAIAANSPVFFVNKYGVGVGGAKASSTYSINSKGNALINGELKATSDFHVGEGSNMERSIHFNNQEGTNLHKCRIYGGNASSQVGLGAWDSNAGRAIFRYVDATNEFQISNPSGNTKIMGSLSIDGNTTTSKNITASSMYTSSWFRSTGNTGWYSETHGGGIHMQDTSWVRVYNNKGFYTGGEIKSGKLNTVGTLNVDGRSTFGDLIQTEATLQVGQNIRLGNSNKDVTMYSYWSDNAHHDWVSKSSKDEIRFGAAKQSSFDSTTIVRGTCVRLCAHSKVASGTSGVFLGSSGSTAVTSDENLKDIYDMDDRYLEFFDNLNPVLYKYKGDDYHRLHVGYGARASEKALLEANIPTEDFGGIVKEKDVWVDLDGTGEKNYMDLYSLRYEEFIGVNTLAIKRNKSLIEQLEARIKELEMKLNS